MHGQHEPPQLESVSSPFLALSEHDGALHVIAPTGPLQTWLEQSEAPRQGCPVPHGEHPPPQSTPVSAPLPTPSVHAGAAQDPAPQTAEAQSSPPAQWAPGGQGAQEPPQSTSDSEPFFCASKHVAGWQTPPLQLLLMQSPFPPHPSPAEQAPQAPPQSTSVSVPFRCPSSQAGATQ